MLLERNEFPKLQKHGIDVMARAFACAAPGSPDNQQ